MKKWSRQEDMKSKSQKQYATQKTKDKKTEQNSWKMCRNTFDHHADCPPSFFFLPSKQVSPTHANNYSNNNTVKHHIDVHCVARLQWPERGSGYNSEPLRKRRNETEHKEQERVKRQKKKRVQNSNRAKKRNEGQMKRQIPQAKLSDQIIGPNNNDNNPPDASPEGGPTCGAPKKCYANMQREKSRRREISRGFFLGGGCRRERITIMPRRVEAWKSQNTVTAVCRHG